RPVASDGADAVCPDCAYTTRDFWRGWVLDPSRSGDAAVLAPWLESNLGCVQGGVGSALALSPCTQGVVLASDASVLSPHACGVLLSIPRLAHTRTAIS